MPISLRILDATLRDSFESLLARWWGQNWPDSLQQELVRWRYHQRPAGHLTWVACDANECVAMLDSRLSQHRLDGVPLMVRETADWYCLPEYRTQMLGLRLMRKMQECGDPILVIDGSRVNLHTAVAAALEPVAGSAKLYSSSDFAGIGREPAAPLVAAA